MGVDELLGGTAEATNASRSLSTSVLAVCSGHHSVLLYDLTARSTWRHLHLASVLQAYWLRALAWPSPSICPYPWWWSNTPAAPPSGLPPRPLGAPAWASRRETRPGRPPRRTVPPRPFHSGTDCTSASSRALCSPGTWPCSSPSCAALRRASRCHSDPRGARDTAGRRSALLRGGLAPCLPSWEDPRRTSRLPPTGKAPRAPRPRQRAPA
eukprot:scaffold111_cov252-Pinguiococcus_pyrenoidosus.AAC.19